MSLIDISLIIVFFVNVILSTLVFLYRKESRGSNFFAIAAYSTALWVFAMFLFRNISDLSNLILPTKLLYVAGISIATNFLYFSFTFLEDPVKETGKLFWLIVILPVISIALIIFSESIISNVAILGNEKRVEFGSLYLVYSALMFFYFIWAYANLFWKLKRAVLDSVERMQLLYVIVGTFISVIFGLTYDIVVPYLGSFTFYWFGPVMTVMFVTATSYSIFKHRLFDIRVIATELLTFAIWIFILVRALLADTLQERLINFGLFGLVVSFGILLIRSILKEVSQREKITLQAKELAEANQRLSEFMSFASHEVRGPLTVMKGIAANILEGDYGALVAPLKDAARQILVRGNDVIALIGQYLSKSKLELGQLKYDFSPCDLRDLVASVVNGLKPSAEQVEVKLSFTEPGGEWPVSGDKGKLQEVFYNLVENAIKYAPKGDVRVSLERAGDRVRVTVGDTGIGIPPEVLPHLFTKWGRAEDAAKVNIKGSGLGLYLAKEFIDAHHGKIWAESEGEGKGSTFFVELPSQLKENPRSEGA